MTSLRPIVILGPTAGGKSELAVQLSEWLKNRRIPSSVLSADSMQIYKHMDAGTAKPSHDQRQRAPHELIDFIEPTEKFTVADWLKLAEEKMDGLLAQGGVPIVVGGTNLYIKALLEGLFDGPPEDPAFRKLADAKTESQLFTELKTCDPVLAERIHTNDRKRLTRALEVFHQTGTPLSELQKQWDQKGAEGDYIRNPVLIGLQWPVEAINQRINLRVKVMFYPDKVDESLAREVTPNLESLIDETRRLETAGLLGPQAREALGYKQVLAFLNRNMKESEAFEKTKILTRRFAKSQRTWLKRFQGVHWLSPEEKEGQFSTEGFLPECSKILESEFFEKKIEQNALKGL